MSNKSHDTNTLKIYPVRLRVALTFWLAVPFLYLVCYLASICLIIVNFAMWPAVLLIVLDVVLLGALLPVVRRVAIAQARKIIAHGEQELRRYALFKSELGSFISEIKCLNDTTLNNKTWWFENEDNLKQIFPQTWTHLDNFDLEQIMTELRGLNIHLLSHEQVAALVAALVGMRILITDGDNLLKANPEKVFKGEQKVD